MKSMEVKAIAIQLICGFAVGFFWLVPSAEAQVDCDKEPAGALQRAIDAARSGDTILVRGTCEENVYIAEDKNRITLDGGGKATIHGSDPNQNTISVRGRGIGINGLAITGGMYGIFVTHGGHGNIDGNTIERTGRTGIIVQEQSSAVIINNTVRYNPNIGITLNGASYANIGFDTTQYGEPIPAPNFVRYNGRGIQVERAASARIAANDISNNAREGLWIDSAGQANISSNTINENGLDGILASRGGGANLGQHFGDGLLMQPNRTTVVNGGFGIRCDVAGYASGRLGSLNGSSGAQNYSNGCVNDLEP